MCWKWVSIWSLYYRGFVIINWTTAYVRVSFYSSYAVSCSSIMPKYFVHVMGGCLSDTTYKLNVANNAIYKNGSSLRTTNITVNGADRLNEATTTTTAIVDMNGNSDYLEAYARVNVTTGTGSIDARSAAGGFGAYRIIGA